MTTLKTTTEEREYFLRILRPLSTRSNAFADHLLDDLETLITENERLKERGRLVPELPSGWVPPFRQASSGVSSHVIDSAEPANWIGDDTVEVSKFLAELLNAVYLPREGEGQP